MIVIRDMSIISTIELPTGVSSFWGEGGNAHLDLYGSLASRKTVDSDEYQSPK